TVSLALDCAVYAGQREDIRWYFEDYLKFPFDPNPIKASRIENVLSVLGDELFSKVFLSNEQAKTIWDEVRPFLDKTTISIVDSDTDYTIPWEILRDNN